MKTLNFVRNKFNTNFYFRMVILYSSMAIMSILIFMFIFIQYQNESMKKQKQDGFTNLVTQFQIFSDEFLLEKAYSIITKDVFKDNYYGLNLVQDSETYKYNPNDFTNALNINKYLKSVEMNTEYIESIVVYNKQYDTYISSKTGIYYNIMDKRETYSKMVNYPFLDATNYKKANQFWFSPNENIRFYNNKQIVSLVQFTPIFVPASEADMVISINIDMDKVFKDFFGTINPERDNFKIIDSENNLLYDTDRNNLLYNLEDINLLDQIVDTRSGYEVIKEQGNRQHKTWITSNVNQWKYIYTMNEGSVLKSFFPALGYIFIWGIIIMAILLIAILMIGKWLYEPLKNLARLSARKSEELIPKGDIKTIQEAFSDINHKLDHLEGIVEKNDGLILNNIIINLINGKVTSVEDLNHRLKILNREFLKESFYILLIEIDPKAYQEFSYEEKELIHITINEILSRYYERHFDDGFKITTLFDYEGYFTCIVNLNEKDYQAEMVHVGEILSLLNSQFTSIFNFALTKPFVDLKDFSQYHQRTLDYFKYRFIYGNGNIFTQELILAYEESSTQWGKEDMQNLEIYLKTQELDLLKKSIMFLFDQIKLNGYSYLYMYNLSIQLIGIISNECMVQNISNPKLSQQSLLEGYGQVKNLDECMTWFYNVIDEFGRSIEVRNVTMEGTVIGDIIDYINENIDNQLSLNSVADYFNLSAGHLSRLFKEKAGTNFSDFVGTAKFEKAAQLLLLNPKTKVVDIAEQLGYSSATYFTKLFKEKHGMTPTQYRKLHRS